jgi:hypothetical protein
MKREKDYYDSVAQWFRVAKGCELTAKEHRFLDLSMLTADIFGKNSGRDAYACELKHYPFPVGSSGYGSIGQALALRGYAQFVYVGCVASDVTDSGSPSRERVCRNNSIRALLSMLAIPMPSDFSDYCTAASAVFRHFFEGLDLGFLIVYEHHDATVTVHELISADGS